MALTAPVYGWAQEADAGSGLGIMHFGDVRYRYERIRNLPIPDVSRHRLRARLGFEYLEMPGFEFGAAVEGQISTDANRDNRSRKDAERSDNGNLDQLYARWLVNDEFSATAGKTKLPFRLSPLLWDEDLRPIGVSGSFFRADENGNGFNFDAGYFAPDFIFDNEKPRMTGVQGGWHWHQGQPTSFRALLSYIDFDKLEGLPARGIARTNRRVGANYLSDFELLDLQLILRTEMMGAPWEFALDGVKNLGADDADEAGRASIVVGDVDQGGFEMGVAYHRNQRDSVLAIAASDDWWFQSFSRGVMPWVGYGFNENIAFRLSAFEERRDLTNKDTHRLVFDLLTRW
jgi:hypothetical protein